VEFPEARECLFKLSGIPEGSSFPREGSGELGRPAGEFDIDKNIQSLGQVESGERRNRGGCRCVARRFGPVTRGKGGPSRSRGVAGDERDFLCEGKDREEEQKKEYTRLHDEPSRM
jgi:hypothetical protein